MFSPAVGPRHNLLALHAVERRKDERLRADLRPHVLDGLLQARHLRGKDHQIGRLALTRLHNVVVFLLAVDDKALAADPLRTRTACDDTQIVAEHRLQPVREICADGSEADQRDCFDLLHGSVSFAVAAQTSSRSRYLGYFTTNWHIFPQDFFTISPHNSTEQTVRVFC